MPSLDDLVASVLGPLRGSAALSSGLAEQVSGLVMNVAVGALVVLTLRGLRAVREQPSTRLRRALAVVGTVAVALTAFGFLDRVLKHRANTLTEALGRWDYWILCALLGQLLDLVTHRWKIRALVLVSLVLVEAYVGPESLLLTLAGGLAGWVAIRFGALFLGGLWSMIEAEALLFGVRLRPNFTGILTAQTPSQFWRAWRATMTHWLIRYVYVPLGGNRRHRTLNIFAAFVVSTVWHAAGVLFVLKPTATAMVFVPIVTWGMLNFVGVAAHSAWRQRWPAGTWMPETSLASRACKIALTLCFGSFTVTVLGFPRDHIADFPRIVCTLAGLARFCGR